MRRCVVENILLKECFEKDALILRSNKVKSVTLIDENDSITHRVQFNENGLAENFFYTAYYQFKDKVDTIEYKILWDKEKRISKLDYKYGVLNTVYLPVYENSKLQKINAEFGFGIKEDYIFTYENERIASLQYYDVNKDTIYLWLKFIYDENGKLVKAATDDGITIDSITRVPYMNYEDIIISTNSEGSCTYRIENGRITQKQRKTPAPQPRAYYRASKFPKYFIDTDKYFYRENGLIDYVMKNTQYHSGNKIRYEYEFFD